MKKTLIASAFVVAMASPLAQANLQLAQKGTCMGCHQVEKAMVGPAYKDVAAKYKGQKDAAAKLFDKVRKGGTGVWGSIPMAPVGADKLDDGELKTVIDWILKGAA